MAMKLNAAQAYTVYAALDDALAELTGGKDE